MPGISVINYVRHTEIAGRLHVLLVCLIVPLPAILGAGRGVAPDRYLIQHQNNREEER